MQTKTRKSWPRRILGWIGWLLLLMALLVLATWALGYTRLPERPELPVQHALPTALATPLDQGIDPLLSAHAGESGFRLVSDGVEAFALRAFSARAAGRSLDVQTYIWHDDLTGKLLARELLAAADRGVRVRLLLDDMDARAKNFSLAALDAHDNIEVRLFNPFASREGMLGKLAEFATSFSRINHRMHNKAWIADNRLAIAGGRNIGNEYFSASDAMNFQDLDFATLGPAVGRMSESFDRYWNSAATWPQATLSPGLGDGDALASLRTSIDRSMQQDAVSPWVQSLAGSNAVKRIVSGDLPVHWTAQWKLLSDNPLKALAEDDPLARSEVMRGLSEAIRHARGSITLISPYFVPGDAGSDSLVQSVATGKAVSILTNSLAANDVAAVHGGYSKYRPRLVEGGVALWELKPDPGHEVNRSLFGSSGASLHTKAALIDDDTVFVGSFNLDPRSVSLNTEQGVLAIHPALGAELARIFKRSTRGNRAWRVTQDAEGELQWTDGTTTLQAEPDATFGRRVVATLMRWLPFDSQL
jgi:putative cardiolipin synthase